MIFRTHWAYVHGHAGWVRLGKYCLQWKSPKAEPLFSEQNGYVKVLFRFRGHRVLLHTHMKRCM